MKTQIELRNEKIRLLEELVYNLTYQGEKKERINLHKQIKSLTEQINQESPQSDIPEKITLDEIFQKHLHENSYCRLYIPDHEFKEMKKEITALFQRADVGQSDIKKEKLNDLIDVEKRDTFTSEQNPSGDTNLSRLLK